MVIGVSFFFLVDLHFFCQLECTHTLTWEYMDFVSNKCCVNLHLKSTSVSLQLYILKSSQDSFGGEKEREREREREREGGGAYQVGKCLIRVSLKAFCCNCV
jgi:hypothetical protein